MTRTDVMASSRPRTAGAAPTRKGTAGIMRRLSLLSLVVVVVMAFVGPGTALAAGSTKSGYNQTPNTPTTGTSPSKESSSPKEATSPSSEAEPTTTAAPTAEKSTLPFTGFDLRWSVGAGLLLMAAGFSIVAVQRRQRRQN
jgi:hypothetical protein